MDSVVEHAVDCVNIAVEQCVVARSMEYLKN